MIKSAINLMAVVVVFPCALTCWIEGALRSNAEGVFFFWTHVFALLPGHPGFYVRRAFYRLTLDWCSFDCVIGFGVLFTHRQVTIEDDVYIGPYAVVGRARLRTGCLIGTRANLLSGAMQHELGADGRWTHSNPSRFMQIEIGAHAWIGEAATVMADVGSGSMVAAGAVVSAPVPSRTVVAGNPARFVREVRPRASEVDERPRVNQVQPDRSPSYKPFIDWMKCLGMLAIAYGHLAGWAPLADLPPIYSKQLGVALFLFATGCSLSRDTRDRWHVAFNRLFEVFLFGLALALLLSAVTYWRIGRLQLSNYEPFIVGVNVLVNAFPANPTTWYLGTYIHIIVLWALVVHRIRVSAPLFLLSLGGEIVVRAFLMETAGRFIAYMLLPNWSTVFLMGYWYGQQMDRPARQSRSTAWVAGGALVVGVTAWAIVARDVPFDRTFPFMRLPAAGPVMDPLAISALVSVLYVGVAWLVFQAVEPLPAPGLVRFIARNSLIIFLAHMPVLFVLDPILQAWGTSDLVNSTIYMLVCVPGLAFVSEGLHKVIQPRALRDRVWSRLHVRAPEPALSDGRTR